MNYRRLIGERSTTGEIRSASPTLRADPADPECGDELTGRHLVRCDNRQVQDNHPASHRAASDLSPSPISPLTRKDRLLRLARLRGDRLAIACLEADREYLPEPDYPVFVAPLRRAA